MTQLADPRRTCCVLKLVTFDKFSSARIGNVHSYAGGALRSRYRTWCMGSANLVPKRSQNDPTVTLFCTFAIANKMPKWLRRSERMRA